MSKQTVVVVGGCGHVGLPLGIILASRTDDEVYLLDIDASKVDQVNRGEMPFTEPGVDKLLREVIGKKAFATTSPECLRKADVVITVVGTPVDEHLNPTVNGLKANVDDILKYLRDDTLLMLRSTLYPGVTQVIFERITQLGRKIHLAFCPERIAEGKALEELVCLPQIISAFEPEALERARKLFSKITTTMIELSPLEAELAKLFTNSWRYLNFAISNEFYMLAETYGLDFYKIHHAVTHEYPRMKSFATAGLAAGPCLRKDTLQLAAFASNHFFLGHSAMLVNEGLPNFIVRELQQSVKLSEKTVAILGMAFKAESDDTRESLSYKLKHLLEVYSKKVLCTDPYVSDPALTPLKDALAEADIIVLATPHAVYREIEFAQHQVVVDCWGVFKRVDLKPQGRLKPNLLELRR
jgi:UDP-N-acetyl-D-mannosaminuronic acid dehydrogenase